MYIWYDRPSQARIVRTHWSRMSAHTASSSTCLTSRSHRRNADSDHLEPCDSEADSTKFFVPLFVE